MTWRGSADGKNRLLSALIYLIPLIDALPLGQYVIGQFPALILIYLPLQPIITFYYQFPFASFIIFLVLFMGVVRNTNISHFIRFSAMQAILMGILLALFQMALQFLARGFGDSLLVEALFNFVFLGALAAVFYSIIQSALGRYAEMPTISAAAYTQVR